MPEWVRWAAMGSAAGLLLAVPVGVELRYRRLTGCGAGALWVALWFGLPAARLRRRCAADGVWAAARRALEGGVGAGGRTGGAAAFRYLVRRVRVRRFAAHLRLGTGDAAATGWAVGGIWAAWGGLLAALRRLPATRDADLRLSLRPEMSGACLDVELRCIAATRALHIIVAALWLAALAVRARARREVPAA